jgi:hypothetical protein
MSVTRRKFMKAGIMVAACAGIPLKAQLTGAQKVVDSSLKTPSAVKATSPEAADMLGYYNKSTFTPHVNTTFLVRLNDSTVGRIKLVEVKDYTNASGAAAGQERFSLFFKARGGVNIPQNTYEVEHAALGTFSLFIVPVGLRSGGAQYFEAAFNRTNN